jgi:hypothetical protein
MAKKNEGTHRRGVTRVFLFLANAQRHKWQTGGVFRWLVDNRAWACHTMTELASFAGSVQRMADHFSFWSSRHKLTCG